MNLNEIKIGVEVWTMGGKWLVTDVGSRVFTAIKCLKDQSLMRGPPYSVVEHVFDEYDIGGVFPTLKDLMTSLNDGCVLLQEFNEDGSFK